MAVGFARELVWQAMVLSHGSVDVAKDAAKLTRRIEGNQGSLTWPFSGWTYSVMRRDYSGAECAVAAATRRFLRWLVTEPTLYSYRLSSCGPYSYGVYSYGPTSLWPM